MLSQHHQMPNPNILTVISTRNNAKIDSEGNRGTVSALYNSICNLDSWSWGYIGVTISIKSINRFLAGRNNIGYFNYKSP